MNIKLTLLSTALATACFSIPALAYSPDPTIGKQVLGHGIHEINDPSLSDMRGRFVAGNNTVMYFGVQMVSTWNSPAGQTLVGGVNMSMDFSSGKAVPTVSFQPTVSIVSGGATSQVADTSNRSIESGGLDNPSGLVQSIQVAGDGNRASNVTGLNVTDKMPAHLIQGSGQTAVQAVSGDSTVSASIANGEARIDMMIADQGTVNQIIRGDGAGSNGVIQSVSALGDNHAITNQLQLTLVQGISDSGAQLRQHVAQSMAQLRGLP